MVRSSRNLKHAGLASLLVMGLSLAGCAAADETPAAVESTTITIDTANGPVEVPVEPLRVAALDNTSFETLVAFGVEPVVVPKPLVKNVPSAKAWAADESILDAGSHREPQLEAVSEAEPDLIIGGYRFADYTDELNKIAPTIDISPSEEAEGGYVESLKVQTEILGEIFNKQELAAELIADLDASVEAAAALTTGQSVFLGAGGGGKVDNGAGRIGRITEPLDLVDVFASENPDETAHHNDSGLAPETVAQMNPDWLIAFDQDAATGAEGATPIDQVIAAQEAWKNTTFVQKNQIVVFETPFYVTEGIQAYTTEYEKIAAAFSAAS